VAESKPKPSLSDAFAVWRRLLPYLRPHRRRLGLAAFLTVLAVAIELCKPWPIKVVIDQVLLGQDWSLLPAAWRNDPTTLTWWAIGATLGLALLGGIATYYRDLRLAEAGQRAVATVRSDALDAVLLQTLAFHERHRAGDLLVRLCGDAPNLRTLLVDGLFAMGREALLVLGTLAVMLAVDWRLALAAVTVLPLVGLLAALAAIRLRRAARKQRKKEGQLAATFSRP
jgi:ATP-binding cassette, subfamily B, bacterial